MLRLEAETPEVRVGASGFSGQFPREVVRREQLHTGLRREHFEHPARGRFKDGGGEGEGAVLGIEDEVMVVAATKGDLRMVGVDVLADPAGAREIEGRAGTGTSSPVGIRLGSTGV